MIINSIALGISLAMDAFSVSVANALYEPEMKKSKSLKIAGTFAFFQAIMPIIGWLFVKYLVSFFKGVEPYIPWIAFVILGFLGIKMIISGYKQELCEPVKDGTLLMQGIATSIDALSVGFTIVNYTFMEVLLSVSIIAFITLIICLIGLLLGKKLSCALTGKTCILGGIILIIIGIKTLMHI